MKRSTIKKTAGIAASFGASWIAQQALLALVPLPVQIPLRILHFCGTTALGAAAARAGKAAIEHDVDDVFDVVEELQNH